MLLLVLTINPETIDTDNQIFAQITGSRTKAALRRRRDDDSQTEETLEPEVAVASSASIDTEEVD